MKKPPLSRLHRIPPLCAINGAFQERPRHQTRMAGPLLLNADGGL